MITFGNYIKNKREERLISLRSLADKLDMSAAYLSDIERGNRYAPDKEKVDLIAKVLGITEQEDIYKLYDLAADSKNDIPFDIREKLMENKGLYELLRKSVFVNIKPGYKWTPEQSNK